MEKYWSEYSQVEDKYITGYFHIFKTHQKDHISLYVYVDNCTGKNVWNATLQTFDYFKYGQKNQY